jgi:uncharacterized protein (DUF1919 family)
MENREFSSPTVGLWFESGGFLRFCENLEENLRADVAPDAEKTRERGYPVGIVNGITIYFQHYPTFEVAVSAWRKRALRVKLEDVFILMTDRDGMSQVERAGFARLQTQRKALFSHLQMPGIENVVYVPGYERDGAVGDLYGEYFKLNQPVAWSRLCSLMNLREFNG